jgi:hypothetical protein
MNKGVGFEEVKQEEYDREYGIIDAILQERIGSGCKETEMLAEKNKRADVPAHEEHADRYADKCRAYRIHISKVFRSQVQGIGAKSLHERAIHRAEQDKPKQKQYLVFPEMQEEQLDGKRVIKTVKPCFHK